MFDGCHDFVGQSKRRGSLGIFVFVAVSAIGGVLVFVQSAISHFPPGIVSFLDVDSGVQICNWN